MVAAHEPTRSAQPASAATGPTANMSSPEGDSGIWVIRKQMRRKGSGRDDDDEVTVLGCYFLVGENIYMAPSIANVIGSRLVRLLLNIRARVSSS